MSHARRAAVARAKHQVREGTPDRQIRDLARGLMAYGVPYADGVDLLVEHRMEMEARLEALRRSMIAESGRLNIHHSTPTVVHLARPEPEPEPEPRVRGTIRVRPQRALP